MPPGATSRYLLCDGRTDSEGRIYLTEPEPYRYRELPDNRFHQVKEGDTIFNLAHRYFPSFDKPAQFFWVIAWFQSPPIIDPTVALTPGSIVVIPSEQTLRQEILNESRRREYTG